MTLEAQQRFGWLAAGMANRLKRHPADVQRLIWHKQGIDEVRWQPHWKGDVDLSALTNKTVRLKFTLRNAANKQVLFEAQDNNDVPSQRFC